MARASAVFASRDARRALDGPAEQAIALGAYDPGRYQEYQKQVRGFRRCGLGAMVVVLAGGACSGGVYF